MGFPAWSAAIVQVPAALPVTVLPLRVQTVGVVLVRVVAKPELAVAVQVLVAPTAIDVGAQDKVMVWLPLAITID